MKCALDVNKVPVGVDARSTLLSLLDVVCVLAEWAEQHADALLDARTVAD
jgi:hypothetical protein